MNQPRYNISLNQARYNISFPAPEPQPLGQDEAYFFLKENGKDIKLRFHDYGDLYNRPGLYEQLFYDRLKCVSPQKVAGILDKVLSANRAEMSELRVLDLGAGNGMVGEILHVARVIGVDISKEAFLACERDRPGAYDAYYVADFCNMDPAIEQELRDWQIDCLTCVAALGFGDIPTKAFATAFNLVKPGGWVAFNIKDTFLQESDDSGFSSLTKFLLTSDTLEIHHLERYRHRISIEGQPLFYYALVGKKETDISPETILKFGGS
ncbi:MAG: class I SAM-dependent methyltransferase [Burkholderiales bacterium]|nr:class I SAM-dependent methyltransferase [Burkholderiales bacterium]